LRNPALIPILVLA